MPCLQRLALDLCTEDAHLVNGQNFIRILPSSVVEIHLFILYYFTKTNIEADTLLSTWPTYIQITCLPNKLHKYAVIHTIPCDLPSIMIPAKIANCMSVGSEYTRKVEDLKIFGEQCLTDIHLIVQHFHQLRTLTIGSDNNSEILTVQSTQPIILHLPKLKCLRVKGTCEIFHLVQAAPNLECLRISLNCFNIALNDTSTCKLLEKRITDLEITRFQEIDEIQLDTIAEKFNHLRDLYIRGLLTDEMRQDLRQWFINHSHLRQEDSFVVEYKRNWLSMWLE
ncbi:unnamed protein product [Rotaria sp. Silwood1]|nr:unnamed protein product [Rotaria sp. Silwood1]CAF1503796.1 unnamed protein product [Rotaria sp. Silwood1]CAF3616703.1 unnamed protein product [Rotaria sp. Silwood1]CAF3631577.1 unnamed protein product [Rotaria sp. Silwood1]CAF3684532.1 unnamed protein product [Rotaria sp. Silwood1]